MTDGLIKTSRGLAVTLAAFLEDELAGIGMPNVKFGRASGYICKVCRKSGGTEVVFNLNAVKKYPLGSGFKIANVYYAVCFAAYFIKLMCGAAEPLGDRYFDEMAGIAADISGEYKLYAPVMHKKPRIFTAAEHYCGIRAILRVSTVFGDSLSRQAKDQLERELESLLMLKNLPETAYYGSRIPKNSLFFMLQRIDGDAVRQIKESTPEELLDRYINEGDVFCGGAVLRLLAFSDSQADHLLQNGEYRRAIGELANEYRRRCVSFVKFAGEYSPIMRDNRIAAEKTVKRINSVVRRHGMETDSPSVYPMG